MISLSTARQTSLARLARRLTWPSVSPPSVSLSLSLSLWSSLISLVWRLFCRGIVVVNHKCKGNKIRRVFACA